jgi:hypothetical protein
MNLLTFLIRITGKNGRQTSDIKTEVILTYQELYFTKLYKNGLYYVYTIIFNYYSALNILGS